MMLTPFKLILFVILIMMLKMSMCDASINKNTKDINRNHNNTANNNNNKQQHHATPTTTTTTNRAKLSRNLCGPDFMDIHQLICKLKELKRKMTETSPTFIKSTIFNNFHCYEIDFITLSVRGWIPPRS